jgi:hypothetical protein
LVEYFIRMYSPIYCPLGAIRRSAWNIESERPACYYNDTREHTYFFSLENIFTILAVAFLRSLSALCVVCVWRLIHSLSLNKRWGETNWMFHSFIFFFSIESSFFFNPSRSDRGRF